MPDFERVNLQELREEILLQLLAVFIRRFGGEVTLSAHEFDMVEGVDVRALPLTPEHLRLSIEDEGFYVMEGSE